MHYVEQHICHSFCCNCSGILKFDSRRTIFGFQEGCGGDCFWLPKLVREGDHFWHGGTTFGNQNWSGGGTTFGNQKWSGGPLLTRTSFGVTVRHGAPRRTRFRNPLDLTWISGFHSGFLDFSLDFCRQVSSCVFLDILVVVPSLAKIFS